MQHWNVRNRFLSKRPLLSPSYVNTRPLSTSPLTPPLPSPLSLLLLHLCEGGGLGYGAEGLRLVAEVVVSRVVVQVHALALQAAKEGQLYFLNKQVEINKVEN